MLFLYCSILIFSAIAIFMKKKLQATIYYGSVCFGVFWAALSDFFVDHYKIYYFFKNDYTDFKTLLVLIGIYPFAAMIIVNWFPYNGSKIRMVVYIFAWSLFSTFYEWLSLQSGILHYEKWKLWHSAVLYPFLYTLLILNVYFIMWLRKRDPLQS